MSEHTAESDAPATGLTIDHEADAAYARIRTDPVARTVALPYGVNLDLAADGGIVGVEVLTLRSDLLALLEGR